MNGRNRERGGAIKTILILAVILYGIYVSIKLVPIWAADKEMDKKTEEILKFAGVNNPGRTGQDLIDGIVYQISKKAQELEVPITKEDIKVVDENQTWHASFGYKRSVDLIVWTYQKDIKIDKRVVKG